MGYCIKCGKTLDDKEFYMSKNVEKYPPKGRLNTCKKCLTLHVDNWNPETYKWILQEIDVPYIKEEWDKLLAKYGTDPKKVSGVTILGRYLSKMKLKQHKDQTWKDTEMLAEKALREKVTQMQAQGLTGEEIDAQLAIDRTPAKPKELSQPQSPVETPDFENYSVPDEFDDQLTEEERLTLRLKWGKGYRAEEWIRMESLYRDMEASYDIQGAGMKDTLIMICKASMRANQLVDAGDIDAFQKMTKVYNELMKSAKLTAAQNKTESGDCIDSIGELVAICERDGFIPKYYIDSPKDKVDKVILDMQEYTHDLVTDELGLGNLIENSLKSLEREREAIQAAAESGDTTDSKLEEELFKNKEGTITDQDFIDFFDLDEEADNE